jgi:hypothetical protein
MLILIPGSVPVSRNQSQNSETRLNGVSNQEDRLTRVRARERHGGGRLRAATSDVDLGAFHVELRTRIRACTVQGCYETVKISLPQANDSTEAYR